MIDIICLPIITEIDILRSQENSPAQSALCFVVDHVKYLSGRRGRHRINLFDVLKLDLKNRDILLNYYHDLLSLRIFASDKKNWQEIFTWWTQGSCFEQLIIL